MWQPACGSVVHSIPDPSVAPPQDATIKKLKAEVQQAHARLYKFEGLIKPAQSPPRSRRGMAHHGASSILHQEYGSLL